MVSESEFVMIRAFDKTLRHTVDADQRLVNSKNAALVRMQAAVRARDNEIAVLVAALAAERAKSAGMQRQIAAFISRQ